MLMTRRKVKNEDVKQQEPMEDLIDLDFSGFGPETVRMDDAWSVAPPFAATDKTRRMNPPQREAQPLPPVQKSLFNPTSPFQGPPAPFPQQGFVPPTSMFTPPGPLPSEPVSMFGGGGIYQHPMDFSNNPFVPTNYGTYLSPPSQMQSQLPPQLPPPQLPPQQLQPQQLPPQQLQTQQLPPQQSQQPSTQANFNVDYMFSGPTSTNDGSLVQQPFMPPYQQPSMLQPNQSIIQPQPLLPSNQQPLIQQQSIRQSSQQHLRQPSQQPSYQPSFMPLSPSLTAVHPQQPPSVMGQFIVDTPPPQPAADSTKTTIVPLMNPGREAPTGSHHQRGLSSVVRNTSVVEDNSSEDEEDYEARIESNELKTDEKVKKKVMSALQSALSDLQLTGIQIKWSDIEVDDRIGVGGFAIVYHGMYRYFLDYYSE